MIEKITLCVADESGSFVEVRESSQKLQSVLDIAIADDFSEINFIVQSIGDEEIRIAEKFRFAVVINSYKKEIKENAIRI